MVNPTNDEKCAKGRKPTPQIVKSYNSLRAKAWLFALATKLGIEFTKAGKRPNYKGLVEEIHEIGVPEDFSGGEARALQRWASGKVQPSPMALNMLENAREKPLTGTKNLYERGPHGSVLFIAIDPKAEPSTPRYLATMPTDFKREILGMNSGSANKRMSERAQSVLAHAQSCGADWLAKESDIGILEKLSGAIMLYRYALSTLHSLDYLDEFLQTTLNHEKTRQVLLDVGISLEELVKLLGQVIAADAGKLFAAFDGNAPKRIKELSLDATCVFV